MFWFLMKEIASKMTFVLHSNFHYFLYIKEKTIGFFIYSNGQYLEDSQFIGCVSRAKFCLFRHYHWLNYPDSMKWKYQRHVEAETAEWESVVRSMSLQLIKDNKKQPIYRNLDLTEQSIESNKDVEQNLDITQLYSTTAALICWIPTGWIRNPRSILRTSRASM